MRRSNFKNEDLNALGRKLLEVSRLSGDEVEKIVASPALFDSIAARIKSEESRQRTAAPFLSWPNLGLVFGFSAVLLVCSAAAAFLVSSSGAAFIVKWQSFAPDFAKRAAESKIGSQVVSAFPVGEVNDPGSQPPPEIAKVRHAGYRKPVSETRKRPNVTRKPRQTDADDEFYSVGSVDDLEKSAEDSQIVRVDLPRSSLYALGVSPPAGNMAPTIKTDLLISSDGVTRAIRFVR